MDQEFELYKENLICTIKSRANKENTTPEKILTQDYPDVKESDALEVVAYITYKMFQDEFEYSDNLVIKPDSDYMGYEAAVDRMCCGIYKEEYTCKSGNVYLLAFDYGH